MPYLQYSFSDTTKKKYNEETFKDYYSTKTGPNVIDGMGVWGRVVLDENGNMCAEGIDTTLKNRIYSYRLSTKNQFSNKRIIIC